MKKLLRTLIVMTLGISLLGGCGNGQGDTAAGGQPMEAVGTGCSENQGKSGERITVTLGTVSITGKIESGGNL